MVISVVSMFEHVLHAGGAGGGEGVAVEAADSDQVGAGGDGFDDVGAAAEAAVDDDLGPAADGGDDFGEDGEAAAAVVELAAAVVADVDGVDPVGAGEGGVLGGADAFQDQRDAVLVLEAGDVGPVEGGLVVHAVGAGAPGLDEAVGGVALAAGVVGGVDGDAEGVVAGGDGAGGVVVDEFVAAADVELEDLGAGGGGGGGFQAGMGDGADDDWDAGGGGGAAGFGGASGVEGFERADGGQGDGDGEAVGEEGGGGVDGGDVAQDAGAEGDHVQRLAVAGCGGLGFGGADEVAPGVAVQLGLGCFDEFVQGLVAFGNVVFWHLWWPPFGMERECSRGGVSTGVEVTLR